MKIILLEDIKKSGSGSLKQIQVKRGFGRYLIRYNKAVYASKENIELLEKNQEFFRNKHNHIVEEATNIAKVLKDLNISLRKKSQDNEKLFGSVTKKNILAAIQNHLQNNNIECKHFRFNVDNIYLDKPIKILGSFDIKIKLLASIEDFTIKLDVEEQQ